MVTKRIKTFVSVSLMVISNYAVAGSGTAKIDTLFADPDLGPLLFAGMSGVSNKPACSTNSNFSFVIDTSTTAGKTMQALLLMAYATGRFVMIQGANTCSHYSNVEDVTYVWLK